MGSVGLVSVYGISLPISFYHRLASASAHFPRLGLRPRLDVGVLRLVVDYIDIHIRYVGDFRLTGQKLGFARDPIAVTPRWFLRLGLDGFGRPFPPEGSA